MQGKQDKQEDPAPKIGAELTADEQAPVEGKIPAEVIKAVDHLNHDPAVPFEDLEAKTLIDFKVYTDKVSLILPSGAKYEVTFAAMRDRLKGQHKSDKPETTLKH